MIYNIKYPTDPLLIVQGDNVNMSLNIQRFNYTTGLWEDYIMTGKSLQMTIKNNHGTIIADWTTASGELIVAISVLTILASAINNITCCGSFDYQIVELSPRGTVAKGIVKIPAKVVQ